MMFAAVMSLVVGFVLFLITAFSGPLSPSPSAPPPRVSLWALGLAACALAAILVVAPYALK